MVQKFLDLVVFCRENDCQSPLPIPEHIHVKSCHKYEFITWHPLDALHFVCVTFAWMIHVFTADVFTYNIEFGRDKILFCHHMGVLIVCYVAKHYKLAGCLNNVASSVFSVENRLIAWRPPVILQFSLSGP